MRTGNCEHCGKLFTAKLKSKRFCSDSCAARSYTLKNNPKQLTDKKCARCGRAYRGTYTSVYCSKKCREKEPKECGYCGKSFEGHYNARYCSMKCKDAYKVRKHTGTTLICESCGEPFPQTFGSKKNIGIVCSVRCSNALYSKRGEYLDIETVEELIKSTPYQMSMHMMADKLNTSPSTVHARANEKYGSYKDMIIALRGRFINTDDARSLTANSLFKMIEEMYGIEGNYEKEFNDLINPLTSNNLRIDFFVEELPLAIEYHGRQHFEHVEFFGDMQSFRAIKTRDYIKKKYLESNNIPLVIFSCYDALTEETVRKKLDKYFTR